MPTKGVQDINFDMSTKFDNSTAALSINKWQLIGAGLVQRNGLSITNQGVNSDLATGNLYVSFSNTNTVETVSVTNAKIMKLGPGDSITGDYGGQIYVSLQADTQNLNARVEEIDLLKTAYTADT
jgi:hypothetical protein